jgi:very-short-patch-repair endonuclease
MNTHRVGGLYDVDDVAERIVTISAFAPADSVVVGFSAAALWGMPLPPSVAELIHTGPASLSRRAAAAASRQSRVDGHSIDIPDAHLTELRSLCVTTAARTWVDCSALVSPDHLLAMGDWALNRDLVSPEELTKVVDWARGRRGVVLARQVLPWLRRGVESAQESRLRWHLIAHEFPEPAINPEVVLPRGRVVRLDLAYEGLRIALEFDGDWHIDTRAHDDERRRQLKSAGWIVIVANKYDLGDPSDVLRQLRLVVDERTTARRRRW